MFFWLALGLTLASPAQASDRALEESLAMVRSPDPKVRAAGAEALLKLPMTPERTQAVVAKLAEPRTTAPDTYRKLILEIWGQVPNPKGYDPMWIQKSEPPWVPPPRVKGQPRPKRPPPHDPEKVDWFKALSELDLSAPELAELPDREAARLEALEKIVLIRALAATRRPEAVEPIFRLAFDYEGVFRDECGRQIRSMESYAVPALIRLRYEKGKGLSKQRRYAAYQLDRMDRARPQKAISAAPDDRVRSEIVHAYGEARALEAVDAILGQVDAPSHRVRREARWAWLRYVTGPPPPPAPKRKRKLPGGKEETEEKPDYYTYREMAELAIKREMTEILGAPPEAKATVKQLTDQLFDYYDKKHAAEWDEVFARAQAKESAGDIQGACDEYGWILAHDPNYARRGEIAATFVRRANDLLQRGDVVHAVGFYRQAVDLAPEGPQARFAGARVAYLDALAASRPDPQGLQRAIELDPSLREAQDELARLKGGRTRRLLLETAITGFLLFAFAWVILRLWRAA